ncbi:MAG: type II toxin-antitoxin system RelE family toxin [Candidatus Anammoxibacter sp.]
MTCNLKQITITVMYDVKIRRKIEKALSKLPQIVQIKFDRLVTDLMEFGPVLPNWKNYSKLKDNKYHCHLGNNWVACWKIEKESLIIEVYYVGSREKAPY